MSNQFGTSVLTALNAAYAEKGLEVVQAPKERRTFKSILSQGLVQWSNSIFGSLCVYVHEHKLSEHGSEGPISWASVSFFSLPNLLELRFDVKAESGVKVIRAQAGNFEDVTDEFQRSMSIPIKWKKLDGRDDELKVPEIREKNVDNVDFLFLKPDGQFVQVQVALSARQGIIWVTVQEIFGGQVVRTTHQKANEIELCNVDLGKYAGLVVPLYEENAYPGSDYLATFATMGSKLVNFANSIGATVPMSQAVAATWIETNVEVSDHQRQNGWESATVAFFNAVIGWGRAITKDGTSVFVHYNVLVNKENRPIKANRTDYPCLSPMTGIVLKREKDDNGRVHARVAVKF